MNDVLLNSPFSLSKKKSLCSCKQKNSLANCIAQELKSNKPKQEKTEKILKLVLQELNKKIPKESLKARANQAWILSLWSKAEIDLLEKETRNYQLNYESNKK
ncbi:MAG: hypothetical protein MRECE_2c103 [Mycoplasmataceae bacterium CE_OT135]|nr:MAG: hypothetical protein MRECE_2c103 [Mycoplasmataceae bacterium CE_OT135]